MIKFFRKKRYNLMEQNNTEKYLKYAIGEIVLVVIGILFALSINNWNEGRKTKNKLSSDLQELKSELIADTETLNEYVIQVEAVDAYGQYLQDFANKRLEEIDTIQLRKAIYYTGYLITFESKKTGYQNLVNQGEIQYIQNAKLKQGLANYYKEGGWRSSYGNIILSSFQEYISYIHKFTEPGTLRSFYKAGTASKNGTLSGDLIEQIKAKNGTLVDWNKLKNDPEFKPVIDKVQTSRFVQIYFYKTIKKEINDLITMIDKELEKE
jgi:hypothetical protein